MTWSDREVLAQRQANLSTAKRALLDRWKRGGAAQPEAASRIPPRPDPATAPLSFAQERLWFLAQLESGNPAYNLPALLRLRGPLDHRALARAFAEIVRRHEILRTALRVHEEEPAQMILTQVEVALPVVDLRRLPPPARPPEAERWVLHEARRPFDLAAAPLYRTLLVRLDDEEHDLLFNPHHVVFDGWSDAILIREITRLYRSFHAAPAPGTAPLPPLALQYGDYAHWQRHLLRGEVLESQLAFWRRQLAGSSAVLELPTDRPRPVVQGLRGAHLPVHLPEPLAAALKHLGRERGTTLYMTLLGALQVLLGRYAHQSDVCVGSPVANRNRSELEELIGFFVNTVVVRGDLRADPDFLTFLERVRQATLGAYANQELPFGLLVEVLSPERDLSRSPLVQVLFALQNAPAETLRVEGLELELRALDNRTSKFDLSLFLTERDEGLEGFFEYDSDLFDRTTVQRLAAAYQTLLEGIVTRAAGRLATLPLLGAAARHQLLAEWQDTEQDLALSLAHQRIAAQAERRPEAVAVSCGSEQLTYRELNRRANQLAHHLRRRGVARGTLVGLAVERSPAMVVGLVAILKSAAAYVPLDPSHPRERLAMVLADTGAPLLVSEQHLMPTLPPFAGRVVRLDGDHPAIAGESAEDPSPALSPADLAYVIYTSGSTGRPKGVAISHGAVVNFLTAMHRRPGLRSDDVLMAVTTLSFDIAVLELFLPLVAGARIEIASREEAADGARLSERLAAVGATILQATPVTWRLLLAAGWRGDERFRILCGGEALTGELVGHLTGSRGRLWNLYGPTETTVWSATAEILPAGPITVGRPIANTRIYLLDRHLKPVPSGVIGELCIGGAGLARGYYGRPALTAASFTPDPFAPTPGARLYHTGDLARCLPDGTTVYLQRRDHQVKVRGFRIELGEIEAVLARHPAVRQAVVVAREDPPQPSGGGNWRLVAYVAAPSQPAPAAGELRDLVRAVLPDYMVPAAWVFLPALPATTSGKVDRRALPEPEPSHGGPGTDRTAPRTPEEEMLAALWCEVLGRARVGIHENFFDVGGHSLLATQLLTRIEQTFQVAVPVRRIFEAPTVAGLAAELVKGSQRPPAPPLRPVPRSAEPVLSFAQQRLWVLDQLEPGDPAYNIPAAVRLRGRPDLAALAASLDALQRRHESLRTTVATVGGRAAPVVAAAPTALLRVVDLRALGAGEREREADRLAAAEARRSFDLARGPLLRAGLLRLSGEDHVLVLTMHHIVSDAWSTGVLIRELSALYGAFRAGRPSPLPALPIRYSDFAHWQRQWLRGEVLDEQLAYWKEQLADPPAAAVLPADRPRPAVWTSRGANYRFQLPVPLARRIRSVSRDQGVTLYMTLLTALGTLLHRYSGQQDLCIGSPIANRGRGETTDLIGFFANTLVMRAALSGDPSFCQLLARVRQTALGAYAHQDLPFEILVEALTPERDLSRSPLFQVMLALQNVPMPRLELPALTLEPMAVDNRTAKFDLTFYLEERDEAISGWIEYGTDLFDATTIRRLLGHYQSLLRGLAEDVERRVCEPPLLAAGERWQLVAEWNATAVDYRENRCLHELIAAQTERTPEEPAVEFEGATLTYRELERRAAGLAAILQRWGVGPEVLVGVFMERSPELVVALVGILKAGGAYLPLDPSYPSERLAFMIADAGSPDGRVPVVLTQEHLRDRVPAGTTEVLCLDGAAAPQPGTSAVSPPTRSENLAYVIYTSGSTGQPKGTMISHRAIVNRLLWMQEAYGLEPGEGVLQKTPFSFDVSVWEFFWPLIVGARLVVARPGGHQESAYLAELIARREVTTVHFVPSMLQVFLEEPRLAELLGPARESASQGPPRAAGPLRRVVSSGEALPWELQERFFSRLGVGGGVPPCHKGGSRGDPTYLGAELHNLYGPTEAAVDVTFWRCEPDPGKRSVPIGRPIANIAIYLLDHRGDPVPVGVPGELCIGGVGLARGYLARPQLTAERFVPDPFGGEAGGRLYRTGDLVRWRVGGEIEYLGRLDHQVKVRGFRIELGEIEEVLSTHPAVREAVVVARRDETRSGQRPFPARLAAYLVANLPPASPDAQPPTIEALRSFLKQRLPDYMVPAAFVFLDAMPLTPSGKVNRRILPAPDLSRPQLEATWVAPSTPQEEILARIWSPLLGVERVGTDDNFFVLGGDSILAIQVVARAQEAGLSLAPRDLFQHQTIAELAAVAVPAPTVEAEQEAVSGPAPLTPIQWWLFERELPAPHHFNQAILLAARTNVNHSALRAALGELAAHHDALRLRFFCQAGRWHQVHAPADGEVAFTLIDLSAVAAQSAGARLAAAAEVQASLDLSRGPLWRVALLDFGPARPVELLWVIHHLAVDGVSWRVLLEDLERLYDQLAEGARPTLPRKTSSFKRWAQRLADYARSEDLKGELSYWLDPSRCRATPLPVDLRGGVNTVASARTVDAELPVDETRTLLQEVPAAYNTQINEVLLTALVSAFAPWTGARLLRVDLEGHGRQELFEGVELSRTVGWLTALYPVVLDLPAAQDPGQELMAVKEQLRAVPRGGIGWGLLRYLSGDEPTIERLRSLPRAEVLFNYLGQLDAASSDGSPWRPLPDPAGPLIAPAGRRSHLVEINGGVFQRRLQLRFGYSENLHRRTTVEQLVDRFMAALRRLIDHCLTPGAGAFTPTDFPEAKLQQGDLDKLFAQIQRKRPV